MTSQTDVVQLADEEHTPALHVRGAWWISEVMKWRSLRSMRTHRQSSGDLMDLSMSLRRIVDFVDNQLWESCHSMPSHLAA